MHVLTKKCLILLLLLCSGVAVAQDRALFWSMEDQNGKHAGYLLGTIHSEDPRVLDFSPAFLEKLHSSDRFAMELVPDLPTLASLTQVMMLPADQNLESLIGGKRYATVSSLLARYGMPGAQLQRMKPWAVMMTLSVPPPETGVFMDFALSLRASGNGVKVIGLETLGDQLKFLEEMPLQQQIEMLDQAVAEADKVKQIHDEMVDIYLENDLASLLAEAELQMSKLSQESRDTFMAEGIDARNLRMRDALLEALSQGTVFAAVGSLHLPGELGLVALMRKEGYILRPQAPPFSPAQ